MKRTETVLTGEEYKERARNIANTIYRNKHPTASVHRATKEYLSKKQEMMDVTPTQDNYQEKLLEDLISKIREILKN
jgi:hypothetical protein